ncbi:MAG: RNA polymerase sigma factor [Acidimicrobiia bacterium]
METGDNLGEEQQLVAAAQRGDRAAFDELVKRTYMGTYSMALRLTANEEDARDVVQEVYLRAWKGIGKFRGDARLSTWLYRITANTASTHLHRRRRHRAEPYGEHHDVVDVRTEMHPEGAAESLVVLHRLEGALAGLSPKLRAIVVLKDVYGLSHEEIAEELGISVAATKVRLHRARRKLRDDLDIEFGRNDRGRRAQGA